MQFMLLSEQYRPVGFFYEVRFLSIIARVLSDNSRPAFEVENRINNSEEAGGEAEANPCDGEAEA